MQLEPHPSQFHSLLETGHRVNAPAPRAMEAEACHRLQRKRIESKFAALCLHKSRAILGISHIFMASFGSVDNNNL